MVLEHDPHISLQVRQVFAQTFGPTTKDLQHISASDRHSLAIMFVPTALSLVALGLSAVALPTDPSLSNNLPVVGSIVDYSNVSMQPLQDASNLNDSVTDSQPLSGDIA